MSERPRPFPPGFLWGAATSAAQIEGAVDEDDRVPSIWDTFAARDGAVRGGDRPTVAADHRSRWREDVELLRQLGMGAYRFSVAWPRRDLAFYDELVDGLLAAGIDPVVTLYHWDLPQSLEDAGGWPVRATAERFGEHAGRVAALVGDRVRRWTTINEPWCSAMLGYAAGIHAPGRREPAAAMAAAHHLLLGHGLAVAAVRAAASVPDLEVGLTLNPYPVRTAGDGDADLDAARRVDGIANRWWYDAVLLGRYPDDVVDDVGAVTDLGFVQDGDLATISTPIDGLGINYYRRHHVRHRAGASAEGPAAQWPGSPDVELLTPPGPTTALGWAIEPEGLVEALESLHATYDHPPVHLHEIGAAFDDPEPSDGRVDDPDRVAYLEGQVAAARRALDGGVDVRSFFAWSLLDNFEWAEGYAARFGIVHVDFRTQARTVKASGRWFAAVARGHGDPA